MSKKVSTYNSFTFYTHNISQYIYIYFLPSPHILKHIKYSSKALLLKALSHGRHIYNAKSPSYERQKLIILQVILMEGNITHIWLKTKRALHGENHLSAWWKGINSTNLCARLYIFSLPQVAPIFPLQSWSHHRRTHNIILYRWTHFIMLLKCHKSTVVLQLELQTVKISQSFSIFRITLLSTY